MNRAGAVFAAIKSKYKKATCKHQSTRKNLIEVKTYVNTKDKDDVVKIIISQEFCKDCDTNLGGRAEFSALIGDIPGTGEIAKARSGV